ncbi:MAG: hypothetical protein ABDI20_04970 [Candidatus Bipolaricaulaceae bacterium]
MAILGAQRAAQEFGLILEMTTAASPLEFLSDLASLAETGKYVLIVGGSCCLTPCLRPPGSTPSRSSPSWMARTSASPT